MHDPRLVRPGQSVGDCAATWSSRLTGSGPEEQSRSVFPSTISIAMQETQSA